MRSLLLPLPYLKHVLLCTALLAVSTGGVAKQPPADSAQEPVRIASPWPAQNTIIAMLGYGKNIVGTSIIAKKIPLFRQVLPSINAVPAVSMGDSHEINPEQIIALRTQLLFVPENMPIPQKEMLQKAGVSIYALKANSMQALVDRVMITGKILGPDAQHKALLYQQYFQKNVELVRQRLQGLPADKKLTVYHSMGSAQITTGRPSLNQDWMDLAGARNVAEKWFQDKKNSAGEVPVERIAAANPAVIITMKKDDAELIRKSPQWQGMSAVKNHRVYVNPQGMFWWCRETSEEALQFLWLAKTLYPERFSDVDMDKETWDFYHTFFGVSLSAQQIKDILHP